MSGTTTWLHQTIITGTFSELQKRQILKFIQHCFLHGLTTGQNWLGKDFSRRATSHLITNLTVLNMIPLNTLMTLQQIIFGKLMNMCHCRQRAAFRQKDRTVRGYTWNILTAWAIASETAPNFIRP